MDICYKIVDAVKKELKLDKLEVKLNPVTSSTRIPLLANGTIDLECGSTTNNTERQKQVAYTNTHFLTASRYVSKKASKINSIDDLKGKSVVSTAGTTNIKQLTEANAARNLNINIIPAKDHAEAFLMVETDRAVAFVMDDILLASLVAGSKAPDDYVISKDAFSKPEPYGIMLRKDDPAFKKVVDAATAALYTSGEGQKIYDKWFTQKIPPKGLNLNVPIGPELKNEFAKPSELAGSGFLQVDCKLCQPMQWPGHCMGSGPMTSGRSVRCSGPIYAAIASTASEVVQTRRARMKHLRTIGLALAAAFCAGAGQCRGTDRDAEEHQGNRRDHARLPRLVNSVFLSGRQPEADRLCDRHLLQDRRCREEGTQARQARGQAQSGDVIDPHSVAGQRHHRSRMRLDHQQCRPR